MEKYSFGEKQQHQLSIMVHLSRKGAWKMPREKLLFKNKIIPPAQNQTFLLSLPNLLSNINLIHFTKEKNLMISTK